METVAALKVDVDNDGIEDLIKHISTAEPVVLAA